MIVLRYKKIIVLLLAIIIQTVSYALDEAFIKNATQKIIREGWKSDPIAEMARMLKSTDAEQVDAYLQAGRILLCEMLARDPILQDKNLKEYAYGFEKNILGPIVSTVRMLSSRAKAKIQILPDNNIVFFLRFQDPQSGYGVEISYLCYKDLLYRNIKGSIFDHSVSDLVVSSNNAFICSINNYWKVSTWTIPNKFVALKNPAQRKEAVQDQTVSSSSQAIVARPKDVSHVQQQKLSFFDDQYIDKDVERDAEVVLSIPGVRATSIINVGKDWYCSVNATVYTFQVDESKAIQNIREVVYFDKSQQFWITKLAASDNILIVNVLDDKQPDAYFFDLSKQEQKGYLNEIFIEEENQLSIKLLMQGYVLWVHDSKELSPFINTYEILKQRLPTDLEQYLAIDINEKENKIALLNAASRIPERFAPKVEYTDLIPSAIKDAIDEFNRVVRKKANNKQEAKELFRNILNKYKDPSHPMVVTNAFPVVATTVQQQPMPTTMTLWQRMYQKIKSNIAWIGAGVAGLVGLSWLYSKRQSPQVPAAWSKVISPRATPQTASK